MVVFWIFLSVFCYGMAMVLRLYAKSQKQALVVVTGVALAGHALALSYLMFVAQGLNFGFFNAASLMMWVVTLLLFVNLNRQTVENLILAIFPPTIITLIFSYFFYTERVVGLNQVLGVKIHILASIIAYSLLAIGAVQAIFLAIQDYQLRHKHPGWALKKLPPLYAMETLLFQVIFLGFIFLSLSLVTGIIFLQDIFAQHLAHKTVLSMMAWLVFAVLLFGHKRYGWRGQRASYWHLGGFALLMLSYFGSKFVLEFVLN